MNNRTRLANSLTFYPLNINIINKGNDSGN